MKYRLSSSICDSSWIFLKHFLIILKNIVFDSWIKPTLSLPLKIISLLGFIFYFFMINFMVLMGLKQNMINSSLCWVYFSQSSIPLQICPRMNGFLSIFGSIINVFTLQIWATNSENGVIWEASVKSGLRPCVSRQPQFLFQFPASVSDFGHCLRQN